MANYAGTIEPMPLKDARKQYFKAVLVAIPVSLTAALAAASVLPGSVVALALFGILFVLMAIIAPGFDSWKIKALEEKGFQNIELRRDGSFISRDQFGVELRGYLTSEGGLRYSIWLR